MPIAQRVSVEEFEWMDPPEDGRLELVAGEVVRLTFPTPRHNRVTLRVTLLEDFVEAHGLGAVFAADTGFILSREPATLRGPDASFIRAERACDLNLDAHIPGAPDLAVEVVSLNDSVEALRRKVEQFLAAGAEIVWVIDPQKLEVEVFEQGQRKRKLTAGDTLEALRLLPSFRVRVAELFPDS